MSSWPTPPLSPAPALVGWRHRLLALAARRHGCLPAAERAQALAGDAWLLGRHGLLAWGVALFDGVVLGLWAAEALAMPLWLTLPTCLGAALAMMLALVDAWFRPHATLAQMRANLGLSLAILLGVALLQAWLWRGQSDLWRPLAWLLPAVAVSVMQAAVAQWGRAHLTREMQRLQLEHERDAAARGAAEARLKVLQAQIQPHFVFNTLAALQHWVDTGDARAAPLLRELSGFLRGSTELMARDEAPLADELALARHYLAIMQARLGERLHVEVDADAAALAQPLPPGLLLSLVENAVEHGVGPLLRAGTLRVRARRDGARFELVVQDNGPGLAPGWQDGVGLANARERLARRFGARATLRLEDVAPGTRATITILDPADPAASPPPPSTAA